MISDCSQLLPVQSMHYYEAVENMDHSLTLHNAVRCWLSKITHYPHFQLPHQRMKFMALISLQYLHEFSMLKSIYFFLDLTRITASTDFVVVLSLLFMDFICLSAHFDHLTINHELFELKLLSFSD